MHVVTAPIEPFASASGRIVVHTIPVATDNLVWLLVDTARAVAAAVDGPGATEVLAQCDALAVELVQIWNTHTHPDHIGINRALAKLGKLDPIRVIGPTGCRPEVPGLSLAVGEGDHFAFADLDVRVLATPGHVDGHVTFVVDDLLLCGDTLFTGGCGFLFDGPPSAMHASLSRLGALDPACRVMCAHEYTQDNLRFAWWAEPDNGALAQRIREVWAARAEGRCTVPSTIAQELETNPFMRGHSSSIRARIAALEPGALAPGADDGQVFAWLRAAKNRKVHAGVDDAALPL